MLEKLNSCLSFEKDLVINEPFREHNEWDSMADLVLLMCLEENFSVKISPELLKQYSTIEDIFKAHIKP